MLQYKVSVIVPIFNTEKYLDKCIQSIINQSYNLHEIILVNDGSTDNSLKICRNYEQIDNRIVVIDTKNEGLVAARKKGIKRATGDYIAFVDSDDWIDEDMFDIVLSGCFNEDVVSFGLVEEYGYKTNLKKDNISTGYYQGEVFRKNIIPRMLYNNIFFQFGIRPNLVTKIIKKNLLDKCIAGISDKVTLGEDGDFTYHALARADSIRIIDVCPYHYIQREESMIHENVHIDSLRALYYDLNNIKLEENYYKQWKQQINAYFVFILLLKKTCDAIKNMPIFSKLLNNKRIIIYGAGNYGYRFMEAFHEICNSEIVGIADRDWKEISKKFSNVVDIDSLLVQDYDYIYISILDENICRSVRDMLSEKNVDEKKIIFLDKKNILYTNVEGCLL